MNVRRVGLIEACDDPRLFNFPLWSVQRRLLASVDEGSRLHVWALGRRASKTTLQALVGLWCCTLRPELLERLRPGERGYAVGVATNLRQGRLLVSAALSIVERSPLLSGLVESSTEDEIRFTNGATFAAFPCTSRGGRGWPVFCLLMDEAAHHIDNDGNSAAERVWQALAPATAQFGEHARVVVASTPWGSAGWFHDLHQRAAAGELPSARAERAPSIQVNPTLDAGFLESERLLLGEDGYAGEYLAEFVGSGGAFLDAEAIADAVAAGRGELSPSDASGWVAGIDPAFSRDPFGLAIVGRERHGRLVLGVARRWLPPDRRSGSFEEGRQVEDSVLAEVAELCRHFRARVVTDQHRAPAVVDRLRREGLSVRVEAMTAQSKSLAFQELRARLGSGELALYEQPELVAELRRLRSRFTAGAATVVNPHVGDSHGDLAQALALAVWAQRGWRQGSNARMSVNSERIGQIGRIPGGSDGGLEEFARMTGLGFYDSRTAPR